MSYLSEQDIISIQKSVRLVSIKDIENISHFLFDGEIEEYNDFLLIADKFFDFNASKTFLLLHRKTNKLLAYMTLSAGSIKLTGEEKEINEIAKVPYGSISAFKVGKLAVNKKLSNEVSRKGYGSFLLEVARSYAIEMNELGVAYRFITVDADIEYNENTTNFYYKNGFIENLSNKIKNHRHTVSMRKYILVDE